MDGPADNGASREREVPYRLAGAAKTDRQLLKRSSATLISRGFSKFAQILFLVVAARLLSVDEFASYSYIVVLASAFTILSDTGVPLVASRDVASGRLPVGQLFHDALPVVLVSGALAALLLPIFGAFDSGPGTTFVPVLLAATYVLFNRFFDLTASLLRSVGRFSFEAILQSVGAVVFIVGSIAVTAAGWGVTAVLAVLCAKEAVSAVVSYVALREDLGHRRPASARGGWRRLLGLGIRLSIAGIALALVMRVPLAVLGNTGSSHEVALFSAAQRFGDAAYILAISLGVALLPGIAFLAHEDLPRARALLHRVLMAFTAAGAVVAAVALPLAEPIMHAIFGSDFSAGAELLRIVLAGMPAYAALGICWYSAIALDGEGRLLGIGLLGLAICAALSALLIPSQGDVGAAWSYVASLYAMAGLSFVVLERQLHLTRHRAPLTASPAEAAAPAELPG
jgi:O-antigen/teichoic acid export membrane protein